MDVRRRGRSKRIKDEKERQKRVIPVGRELNPKGKGSKSLTYDQ